MIIKWQEPNGTWRREKVSMFIEDCIEQLMKRGCKHIAIEKGE